MSNMKSLIESLIIEKVLEEVETSLEQVLSDTEEAIKNVSEKIKSKYGFEVSHSKSSLGGKEKTTFFMKVFGPKSTWTNNIALNSPVSMTISIRINPKQIEMIQNSYQMRDKKLKMRKTVYKDVQDLSKKLLEYFSKNEKIFKELLEEASLKEERYYVVAEKNGQPYRSEIFSSIEEANDFCGQVLESGKNFDRVNVVSEEVYIQLNSEIYEEEAFLEATKKMSNFDKKQLEALKVAYSGLKKIDPSGPAYAKLKKIISDMSDEMLKSASEANINFVSALARNELFRRDMKKSKIEEQKGSDYTILHKDFSSAVQHAIEYAEKRGYSIDEEDLADKVASGPRKPGTDKTNSYHIDLYKNGKKAKQMLHIQVYNTGTKYELNTYIS
jgi:hypothetical protein